jgi:hypothetical protein
MARRQKHDTASKNQPPKPTKPIDQNARKNKIIHDVICDKITEVKMQIAADDCV